MSLRHPLVLLVVVSLGLAPAGIRARAAPTERAADLERLLRGVEHIGKPGVPGPIALVGDHAFAVVAAPTSREIQQAVVAAARVGRGRVVAFGHGGYLSPGTLREHDTAALVVNAVRWAGGDGGDGERVRVGLVDGRGAAETLTRDGLECVNLDRGAWPRELGNVDVLVCGRPEVGPDGAGKALERFVRRGGGLVTSGLAWGWKQLNPGRSLRTDHRLNAVLGPMGLFFADGMVEAVPPVPVEGRQEALDACHAGRALTRLERGSDAPDAQAGGVIASAFRWAPASAEAYRDAVRQALGRRRERVVPTRAEPIRAADVRARLAVLVDHVAFLESEAGRVVAAPSAAEFPGAVPRNARRSARTVEIPREIPGWASTGLYAVPGETVRVEAREVPAGCWVRIGCHADRLWDKDEWRRHPEITHRVPLGNGRTEIANPHGGLLYVEVPERAGEGSFAVAFQGAVAAPLFVLDTTEVETWRRTIRRHPAPWAELATRHVVLTVPSDLVRDLDDPTPLLRFWEQTLGLYAELGARPLARRAERFVPDRQISAGWLHAGYPIMAQEQHAAEMVDLARLRDVPQEKTGAWGFWHELGHNHQRGVWTFGGTVEVTCNLFSLYVEERVRGVKPRAHPWAANHRGKVGPHVEGDRSFERWKRDPGLALWMYILLQDAFGWDAFREVFAGYVAAPAEELPRTDAEKRDQWLVRLSRAVDRDLGPYFEAWGIPVSDAARAEVADLPEWMPDW